MGVVATLLGIIDLLSARIAITPTEPLRAAEPFSAIFTVQNTGFYRVMDVRTNCRLNQVLTKEGLAFEGLDISDEAFDGPSELSRDETHFTVCALDQLFRNKPEEGPSTVFTVTQADVCLVIAYRPLHGLLWQQRRMQRFATVPEEGGHLRWLPMADDGDVCLQSMGQFRRSRQAPADSPTK